ncbi:MAG: hypothetical protein AAB907_03165, partial [Patescibacteria group bacterium]
DGEIVETSPTTSSNDAQVLLNLESLIKNNVASVDKLTEELKALRQMFADAFNNDPTYKELEEKAKDAIKAKTSTKSQLLRQPSVMQAGEKIKSISSEIREKKDALSEYLLEYQRLSGVNEIEGHDGEVREIIHSAKLIKKASKK